MLKSDNMVIPEHSIWHTVGSQTMAVSPMVIMLRLVGFSDTVATKL